MRRLAAAALLLLAPVASLGGCAGVFGPSSGERHRVSDLAIRLDALPGVFDVSANYYAGIDQGDTLRVELSVGSSIDAGALPDTASSVLDAIREADFEGSERDVVLDLADGSQITWRARAHEELSAEKVADFVPWWTDPRVAQVTASDDLGYVVDLAAAVDTSTMVSEVYAELAASVDDDRLAVRGDSWSVLSDHYLFTAERLAMAAEVAGLAELQYCQFSGEGFYADDYRLAATCTLVEGAVLDDVAPVVNAVLESRGMLDDTNVELSPPGGAAVGTNTIGRVSEPS